MDRTWLLFTKAASSRDSRIRLAIDASSPKPREHVVAREHDVIVPAAELDSLCSCCHRATTAA